MELLLQLKRFLINCKCSRYSKLNLFYLVLLCYYIEFDFVGGKQRKSSELRLMLLVMCVTRTWSVFLVTALKALTGIDIETLS